MLQRLYLEQIRNDIRLRIISSNGSSQDETESLRAERRRLEADIYQIARNLGEFSDIARLGAYRTFIGSANEKEAEMAKADYDVLLRQMQAKLSNGHNSSRGRRMDGLDGVRIYKSHHRRH
jgi:hypothetical protein